MQRIDRDSIDMVTDKIIEAYKKKGYLDIQVAPVITEEDEAMTISFFIFEGRKYRVNKISFEGITFDENLFREIMNLQEDTVYDPYKLDSDLERIIAYYKSLGYLEARIKETDIKTNRKNGTVDIRIIVKEGKRFRVGEINIEGNSFFKKERILRFIRPPLGESFNETELLNSKFKLLDEYKREGFLDAKIAVASELDHGRVKIFVKIKEGKRYRVGKIIVRGNVRTRTEVILREIQLNENDPLDFRVLSESSRKLYRLGLFKDIKITTTSAYDHKKDILIEVRERPHGMFEFGLGYGEYEGGRAMLNWSYNNISGMNRRINIRLEGSKLKKRFFINYHEPYFGRSDTSFNAVFQYIEKERIDVESNDTLYKIKKYSSEVSLERQIFQDTKGFIAYNYSLVKTYEVKPDVVLSKEDRGTLGISSIRPGFLYDSRDHPFDPRHGLVFGASLKLASRFLLSETDFYKLTVSSSFYYPLSKRVTAAIAFRGGFAEGFGDTKELPIVERFFLGGRNSVRGFAQDSLGPKGDDNSPTGGNAFLMGSFELRIDTGRGIGLVVFIDTGNVWERLKDIDFSTRKTAGVGIRIRTPVGPVRFDYGHKLDRRDGESSGELHFSIGHAF
ncbi:MAG: outer membrane protein assembly factor BamA [Nitrospirae bacterium]|nr:outer membrane protein assembly factor BamA [Nitrospirota bacterium]